MKKASNIQAVEVYVLNEYEKDKFKTKLRIVKYIIDGTQKMPKLEKRQFYKFGDGEWRTGKNMGMTYTDVSQVVADWKVVGPLLQDKELPDEEKKEPF